jgi:3-deoxy-D-manno-octulosonic-acid transferase
MLGRISVVCAQDQTYAKRFVDLGARAERVQVTGTMKFDTASVADRVAGDEELAGALKLNPETLSMGRAGAGERIWVCGSTGPGEEELILRQFRALLAKHARLRLIIVPRKPERFEEVAELITVRIFAVATSHTLRSAWLSRRAILPPVIRATRWGAGDFYIPRCGASGRGAGRPWGCQRGGDMIQSRPAPGRPVVVGPVPRNFTDAVSLKAAMR